MSPELSLNARVKFDTGTRAQFVGYVEYECNFVKTKTQIFRFENSLECVEFKNGEVIVKLGQPEHMVCHGKCQNITIGMLKRNYITCTVCLHEDVYDIEHGKPQPLEDQMFEALKKLASAANEVSTNSKFSMTAKSAEVSAWEKMGGAQVFADKVIKRAEKELNK